VGYIDPNTNKASIGKEVVYILYVASVPRPEITWILKIDARVQEQPTQAEDTI